MTVSERHAWGIATIRIVVGVVMLAHGIQKLFVMGIGNLTTFMSSSGFPLPLVSALAITGVEVLGGLALLVGLYTRLVAVPVGFAMLVALLFVHLPNGFFLPNGIEFTLTLVAASVGLALAGPGALAVDNRLESTRPDARSHREVRRAA